ncbi:MAG: hypothetical protein JOZ15_12365 [Acidobacteria bacterium]|nr:hypothetical protein [Acidobacteriota bacterium]
MVFFTRWWAISPRLASWAAPTPLRQGSAWSSMSTRSAAAAREEAGRSLGEFVLALVARLGEGDPAAAARLREVVGARHARITLDDQTVEVWFTPHGQLVTGEAGGRMDGEGSTQRVTTLRLLDGEMEVSEAILAGSLEAVGEVDEVARMFQAIEILLDGAVRNPALQTLARDYRAQSGRAGGPRLGHPEAAARTSGAAMDGGGLLEQELELLRRLDLLS